MPIKTIFLDRDGVINKEINYLYKIDDFEPDDVEDITTLPCPDQVDTTCLALADVGDNKKKRKSYAIIIVKEPQPPFQDSTLKIVKKIKFTYPFGPRNCETIFYSQSDKKIIGVTKTKRGESGKVYSLDPKLLDQQAKVISNFPLDSMSFRDGIVTGGAINSSSLVALRLYQYLEIFRWQGIEKGGLKYLFRFKHSLEKQGEAVEFSADGKKLLTISEGNNPHFFRVELDKAVDCLFH